MMKIYPDCRMCIYVSVNGLKRLDRVEVRVCFKQILSGKNDQTYVFSNWKVFPKNSKKYLTVWAFSWVESACPKHKTLKHSVKLWNAGCDMPITSLSAAIFTKMCFSRIGCIASCNQSHASCNMQLASRYLPFAFCQLLFVSFHLLVAVCQLLSVSQAYQFLFACCYLLLASLSLPFAICHLLIAICQLPVSSWKLLVAICQFVNKQQASSNWQDTTIQKLSNRNYQMATSKEQLAT